MLLGYMKQLNNAGWHPFMPINHQGYYRFCDREQYQPLSELVTQVGQFWSGQVNCFQTNSLSCTLLARWDEGYAPRKNLVKVGQPSPSAPTKSVLLTS
jgi:hypothetical protein